MTASLETDTTFGDFRCLFKVSKAQSEKFIARFLNQTGKQKRSHSSGSRSIAGGVESATARVITVFEHSNETRELTALKTVALTSVWKLKLERVVEEHEIANL